MRKIQASRMDFDPRMHGILIMSGLGLETCIVWIVCASNQDSLKVCTEWKMSKYVVDHR